MSTVTTGKRLRPEEGSLEVLGNLEAGDITASGDLDVDGATTTDQLYCQSFEIQKSDGTALFLSSQLGNEIRFDNPTGSHMAFKIADTTKFTVDSSGIINRDIIRFWDTGGSGETGRIWGTDPGSLTMNYRAGVHEFSESDLGGVHLATDNDNLVADHTDAQTFSINGAERLKIKTDGVDITSDGTGPAGLTVDGYINIVNAGSPDRMQIFNAGGTSFIDLQDSATTLKIRTEDPSADDLFKFSGAENQSYKPLKLDSVSYTFTTGFTTSANVFDITKFPQNFITSRFYILPNTGITSGGATTITFDDIGGSATKSVVMFEYDYNAGNTWYPFTAFTWQDGATLTVSFTATHKYGYRFHIDHTP